MLAGLQALANSDALKALQGLQALQPANSNTSTPVNTTELLQTLLLLHGGLSSTPDEEAGGFSIGVAVGFLFVGLLLGAFVGFMVGARAVKLIKALQVVPQLMSPSGRKAAAAAAAAEAAPPSDANGAETAAEEDPELREELTPEAVIEGCLDSQNIPGLDDHANVTFNPVLLYQVKRYQEQVRIDMRRKQMIEDGLDPDDEALDSLQIGMGGPRMNALKVLESSGATLSRAKKDNDEDGVRETRRKQKTIDTFLAKQQNINTHRTELEPRAKMRNNVLQHLKLTALDVATNTEVLSPSVQRGEKMKDVAHGAREQLRFFQQNTPLKIAFSVDESDGGAHGTELDQPDIESLGLELANDMEGDESGA